MIELARQLIRFLQLRGDRPPMPLRIVHSILLLAVFTPLWTYLRVRSLISGYVSVMTQTQTGLQFECRLPDMIQTYLYLFGVWEPDATAFVRSRLQPGDTFIDIGANVGYYTLLAAQRIGKAGKVIAIEPAPLIHDQLQQNVILNALPCNIDLLNTAVAEKSGMVEMYRGPAHNVGLTSTRPIRNLPQDQSVPAAPLDELVRNDDLRNARLIKIDVEGGEDAVLAGMAKCIERLHPEVVILVELSPTWWEDESQTPPDFLSPFLSACFNVYAIPNDYWPWRQLWPGSVERPKRVRGNLDQRVERLDLVLSKVDADVL